MAHHNAPGNGLHSGQRSSATLEHSLYLMLQTHLKLTQVLSGELLQCMEACVTCATTCTVCADACLAEEHVHELTACIALNMNCAEICHTTGHVLMRQVGQESQVVRKQVDACQAVCARCAAMCEQHAEMHDHCRICAEACRHCEQACAQLLDAWPA